MQRNSMEMFQLNQLPNSERYTRNPSDNVIHRQAKTGRRGNPLDQEANAVNDQFLHVSDTTNIQMLTAVDAPQISMKCANCEKEEKVQMQAIEEEGGEKLQMKPAKEGDKVVQMQPDQSVESTAQNDEEENLDISPDAPSYVPSICALNPVFPDFNCFLVHLKRNIDTNLYNNAHHFMRIARLYPDDSQMMEDAFMRYGLGVNILETSYKFFGADAGLATGLAYGTGVGLKALDFFSKGELMLDFQIDLADDVNLDLQLDLNANPDNLTDIRGASAGVGISGHF